MKIFTALYLKHLKKKYCRKHYKKLLKQSKVYIENAIYDGRTSTSFYVYSEELQAVEGIIIYFKRRGYYISYNSEESRLTIDWKEI